MWGGCGDEDEEEVGMVVVVGRKGRRRRGCIYLIGRREGEARRKWE